MRSALFQGDKISKSLMKLDSQELVLGYFLSWTCYDDTLHKLEIDNNLFGVNV